MKEFQPHPEVERSYHELREEFRAKHLSDLRAQFGQKHRRGWNQIITELERRNFTPEGWAAEMLQRLDAPVIQDFGLPGAPAIGRKLEEQAKAALEHDSVTWADNVEGVVDHDAAPLPDISTLTDDQLCDYVAAQIEASKEK